MGLADDRKPVNLMTVHVSKSVTVHEVSNSHGQMNYRKDFEPKRRNKMCRPDGRHVFFKGKVQMITYLQISNNRAERKAKSYAIGRKAFLFHTSETGAGASAVMYSIVETAKANNLNIFQYLYTVLLYMPDYMNSSAGIEQLMPWSEFIKEQCSGLIDVESNVPEKRIPLPHR